MHFAAPILFNSREVDPVPFFEDAQPAEVPDAESDDLFDEWQVAVCVLRYQHVPRFCTLWVVRGETLTAFCAGASELLCRAGGPEDFVMVDPSPFPDMVTFVVVPHVWRAIGHTLCAVAWPPEAAPHFAVAADSDTTLDDFLSDLPLEFGTSLDVFVDGPILPTSVSEPFQPADGTLLSICREGQTPATLCCAAQLLSDPSRATVDADLPRADVPDEVWLMLSPLFATTVLRRDERPAACQIAHYCHVAEPELLLWHCAHDVSHVAIQGVACSHLVAIRRNDTSGQTAQLKIIFMDPRSLGFCWLPSGKARASLADIQGCLELESVPGYQLNVWRNELDEDACLPVCIETGDAWTIRLLPTFPSRGVTMNTQATASDPEADGNDERFSRPGPSLHLLRSRSPRRTDRGGRGDAARPSSSSDPVSEHVPADPADDAPPGRGLLGHHRLEAGKDAHKCVVSSDSCDASGVLTDPCNPLAVRPRPLATPCRNRGTFAPPLSDFACQELPSLSCLRTTLGEADAFVDLVCAAAVAALQPAVTSSVCNASTPVVACEDMPAPQDSISRTLSLATLVGPVAFDLTLRCPWAMTLMRLLPFCTPGLLTWSLSCLPTLHYTPQANPS